MRRSSQPDQSDERLLRAKELFDVLSRTPSLRAELDPELDQLLPDLLSAGFVAQYDDGPALTPSGDKQARRLAETPAYVDRVARGWNVFWRGWTEDPLWQWAPSQVVDWSLCSDEPFMWKVTLALCKHSDNDEAVEMVGHMLLEDFILEFADSAVDAVDRTAATNRKLLKALAHVQLDAAPIRPRIDQVLTAHGQERE